MKDAEASQILVVIAASFMPCTGDLTIQNSYSTQNNLSLSVKGGPHLIHVEYTCLHIRYFLLVRVTTEKCSGEDL